MGRMEAQGAASLPSEALALLGYVSSASLVPAAALTYSHLMPRDREKEEEGIWVRGHLRDLWVYNC